MPYVHSRAFCTQYHEICEVVGGEMREVHLPCDRHKDATNLRLKFYQFRNALRREVARGAADKAATLALAEAVMVQISAPEATAHWVKYSNRDCGVEATKISNALAEARK